MSKNAKLEKALNKVQAALEGENAEQSKVIPPDEFLSEKVPFRAFKDNDKYKDDIIVIINGKTWQIQRGIQVMIPRFVLHAIENAERQKANSANHNQALMAVYEAKSARLS